MRGHGVRGQRRRREVETQQRQNQNPSVLTNIMPARHNNTLQKHIIYLFYTYTFIIIITQTFRPVH